MNKAVTDLKPRNFLDPVKEAQAVAALKESLRQIGEADDEQLVMDSIEGETEFFDIIDRVLERIADAEVMVEGIGIVTAKLSARKTRYEQRIKSDRAAIEQAMTMAELSKIERPTATLSLSARAPSLTITEASDIPSTYWKAGDPVLDKKALLAALKAREEAIAALPDDPAKRAVAAAALPPEIPGACLSNGAPSLTLRRA